MLNIVLHEPEIPQNTGNIGRTCVITGARLHLIRPLGFRINEKTVKRAGLDYWPKLDVIEHDNVEAFYEYFAASGTSEDAYTASEVLDDISAGEMCSSLLTERLGEPPHKVLEDISTVYSTDLVWSKISLL